MEPLRIDIPSAKPPSVALAAADILIDAIREAGVDPRKAYGVPIIHDMAVMWRDGEMTRAEFVSGCRKFAILNPAAKAV